MEGAAELTLLRSFNLKGANIWLKFDIYVGVYYNCHISLLVKKESYQKPITTSPGNLKVAEEY